MIFKEETMSQKYRGACHCGLTQFEIEAEIESVRVCNCSICQKRGTLIYRVENDKFQMLSDINLLSIYEWHTKTAQDFFCPQCGIMPFRKPRALTSDELLKGMVPFDGWAVNVRCIEGINITQLPVITINGRELD
jgi:hypothetical protein